MSTQPIDYDALAKQAGAISSQSAPVDYAALAKQSGAVSSTSATESETEHPGMIKQMWNWANKGLISKDTFVGALTGMTPDQLDKTLKSFPEESPVHAAVREFTRGALQDTSETASSFTSPLAVGTMAVGATGKIPGAIGKVAKAATGTAAAGFGAKGVSDVVGAGTENTPEAWQQRLQGGAMAVGGAAGVAEMAKPPLRAATSAIAKMRSPLGDTVNSPRGTITAESATPVELKAYADANNIPLTAAQATEHNFPRNIQSVGERATIGGTGVKQQIKAAQAAVATHTENLMNQMSPNTPTIESAGDVIKQRVHDALDQQQQAAKQNYADLDKLAQGVNVNLEPVKKIAAQLLNDSSFLRDKVPSLDAKRASGILKGIASAPDEATFSQAQELRSALLDESRSPDLAISQRAQAWIKQLTGSVDGEMMNAAKSKTGLEPTFRVANEQWKAMQEDFNNPRSPLNQILSEPDPSKVPQKLTQKGQIGGSPYNAQLLDKYGVDKGAVKRVILQDLASKDFKLFNNKSLGGYSDSFLQSVFTPQELDHVYKTGAIARSVGMNTNTSGTAAVSGAAEDIQKPVRSLLPKSAAAWASKDAGFNQWLMNPRNPPSYQAYLMSKRIPVAGVAIGAAGISRDQK